MRIRWYNEGIYVIAESQEDHDLLVPIWNFLKNLNFGVEDSWYSMPVDTVEADD